MSERIINKELTIDGLKKCGVCLEVKPISEFKVKKDRGRLYHQYLCGECERERDKKYKSRIKEEKPEVYNKWKESAQIRSKEKQLLRIPKRTVVSEECRKENARIKSRMYYYKNRDRELFKDKIYGVKYRSEHKEEIKQRQKESQLKGRERRLYRRMIDRLILNDEYIKSRIQKYTGLKYKSIPPDLVGNWAAQIKTNRLIKQLKLKKDENT